jgi:hypothetical protein
LCVKEAWLRRGRESETWQPGDEAEHESKVPCEFSIGLSHICDSIDMLPFLGLALALLLLLLGLAGGHGARVLFGCHGVGTRQFLFLGPNESFCECGEGRGLEIGRPRGKVEDV